MTDNGNTPKSPNLKQLEQTINMIDEIINAGHDVAFGEITDALENSTIAGYIDETQLVVMRDALDWTHTYLVNRRDYHKKRQTLQKIETALLEEKLQEAGIDVRKLKHDAERLADDEMIDRD